MTKDIKELLDNQDLLINAFHRSGEQLDLALEMNRSITKALRESRKARNQLLDSVIKVSRLITESND